MDSEAGAHRALGRRPLLRWLAPAGGLVVVAAILVALVAQASGKPACANASPALPSTPTAAARWNPVALADGTHTGTATNFDGANGGNCSFGPPPSDLYVALSPTEYAAGAACGGYLDVTGPKGTVRVKVVDQCPECATGHLDLSRTAFAKIGTLSAGIIPVTYKAVRDPALPGALQLKVKDGASRYWLAVLADNHGNPLSTVEVKQAGGWVALRHTDYNYWIKQDGAGGGPFSLRLTDIYGHQAMVTGITLSPLKLQQTTVFMYGAAPPRPSTRPSAPSPSPSPSASLVAGDDPTSPASQGSPSGAPSRSAASRCH